jgi:hypothetical protein
MIELAIATGIPWSCWSEADDATLATALDVLRELADGR